MSPTPNWLSGSRVLAAGLLSLLVLAGCKSDSPRRDESLIPYKQFEAADTNQDGKLSRDEVAAEPELAPMLQIFDRIDTDHSGLLSWMEVRAARFPMFRQRTVLERELGD